MSRLSEGARALAALLDGSLGAPGALRRPRLMTRAVAVLFLGIVLWMAFAPIDRVVRATGRVVPSGKNQIVQHLEGGVVAAIHATEGQRVDAGALLVVIADTSADADVKERRVRVAALKAKVARLRAEAEGAPAMPDPPANEPDAAAPWAIERQTFAARKTKVDQAVAVQRAQLNQRREEVIELQARRASLREEITIAERQLETMQTLLKRRAASDLEILEAKARLQRLITQTAEVENRIPQTKAMINEINERIGSEIANFRAEARADLSTANTDARGMEEEMRSRADRLSRTEIRAPVSGIINRVMVTTIGGVVRPGDPVVEITPTDGQIVIEGQVLPIDRAELRPGLPSIVKVGAYDYSRYGTLTATVREVSADTLSDERGNRFYRTLIYVSPDSAKKFKNPVLPGMTATADIVLGQRTVGSYLMSSVLRFSSTAFRDNQ